MDYAEKRGAGVHGAARVFARLLLVALVISFSLALTACEGDDEDTATAPPASETPKGAAPAGGAAAPSGLARVEGTTPYSIDTVGGQPVPKSGPVVIKADATPKIIVAGWAVDARAQAPAGGVMVNIDGTTDLPVTYGSERADVANVLKNPNYKMSGFGIALPASNLSKGRHTLSLKVLTADRKGYYETDRKVELEIQ